MFQPNFILLFTIIFCVMVFTNALDNVERRESGDSVPGLDACVDAGTRVVEDDGSRPNHCVTKMNDPIAGN